MKSIYAGFWRRGIALMLDFFIIELIGFFCICLFAFGMHVFFRIILKVEDIGEYKLSIQTINQVLVITMFILMNLYFIFMHGKYGTTLGKMIVKIRVVKTDYTPIQQISVKIKDEYS